MVNLLIIGPNEKMGQVMVIEAVQNPEVDLVVGVGPPNREHIRMDLGSLVGLGRNIGVRISDCIESVIALCDVVVDICPGHDSGRLVYKGQIPGFYDFDPVFESV